MVWVDSPSLLKRCAYCHESVSVFEGLLGDFGKWYHNPCLIHLLWKEIWNYRKKFIDRKLTFGDAVDLSEKLNLYNKLRSEKTEFKGIKHVTETKTQERVIKENVVSYIYDPQATRELEEALERAKNRILEDRQKGDITEEQAKDRLADLMGRARDLAQQQATKITPVLVNGKLVVKEVSTTVKQFKYNVSRPEIVQTVSENAPRLTYPENILNEMKKLWMPQDDPFLKLFGEGELVGDDEIEVLERYKLSGKSKELQTSDEGNSGSREGIIDYK